MGGHTYVGVSFWDLLNTTVGIPVDATVENDVLGKYVVATGSDGYQTLFSLRPGAGESRGRREFAQYTTEYIARCSTQPGGDSTGPSSQAQWSNAATP